MRNICKCSVLLVIPTCLLVSWLTGWLGSNMPSSDADFDPHQGSMDPHQRSSKARSFYCHDGTWYGKKAPGWHQHLNQIFFSVQVFCSCLNSCTTWDVEELVQDFSHLHVTPKSHRSPKTKRVQAYWFEATGDWNPERKGYGLFMICVQCLFALISLIYCVHMSL